ncbi:F420H(2)-dependent quinone reductase [Microbacterium rhizosphaerae]
MLRLRAAASVPRRFRRPGVAAAGSVDDMPLNGEYLPSTAEWARTQAESFEASQGAEANTLRGKPIIVLTTVGAKTGALRKTALMRVEHEGEYAVVASKGGAPDEPKWAENMRRHPHVELQDGDVKRDYTARELSGDERAEWWARAAQAWPDYDTYQTRTDRQIAIFVLEPNDA